MKKTLVLFLIIFGIVNIPVSAETFEFDLNEETNLYQQMYEDYKVDELSGNLNNEVEDLFSKLEINPENPFSFSNLFSKDGLKHFKNYISNSFVSPFKSVGIILISIIVCAFCNSLYENNMQVNNSMNMICLLSVVTVVVLPVSMIFNSAIKTISTVIVFITAFIPIFAGILIASLRSGTAAVYSSVMFFTCETISYCSKNFVLPFANCFTALSIATGITGTTKLQGITRMLKKCAYILITAAMSIFLAVLSIQSVVSSSADTAATKTVKFFVSSFVPIIGPAISESLGSIKGCIGLLKSSVGIYAVLAVILMFLPIVIRIIILKLTFTFSSDVADMFSVNSVKFVIESLNQALSIILSVILCVALMFVFSLTIISVAGGSV